MKEFQLYVLKFGMALCKQMKMTYRIVQLNINTDLPKKLYTNYTNIIIIIDS